MTALAAGRQRDECTSGKRPGNIAQPFGHAYTLLTVIPPGFAPRFTEPVDGVRRYNGFMTNQALEILQKALALSDKERASIAGSLLESLDGPADDGVEAAWNEEVARRIDDLDSGKATTVPWEELRARTLSRLSNAKNSR